MKLIHPSFEIIEQKPLIDGIFKQIEFAGRTCYRSEDKITNTSARGFVERMIKSEHYAMLEHGTVYLTFDLEDKKQNKLFNKYKQNKYTKVNSYTYRAYVTTNYRVIVENKWEDDLKYLYPPTIYHPLRVTVLFHTQIAISREFNRHRVNSIAESSTRYCNYAKNKFGNEITVNMSNWVVESQGGIILDEENIKHIMWRLVQCYHDKHDPFPYDFTEIDYWLLSHIVSEYCYMGLINCGMKPQQARTVLPLDTNTDLVHTAFVDDWKHFFDLRADGTTGAPHPDAKNLAFSLFNEFKKRYYI